MLDTLALNDKKYLVVMFSIMMTILAIYCILKLCFILSRKNITSINKVFHIYYIIFSVSSTLYAVIFAIFTVILFKLDSGLKPEFFFFIYALVVLGVSFMDLAQLLQKNPQVNDLAESE